MIQVVIKTAEPVSTREYIEMLVKIIENSYVKSNLEQLSANATQLNTEERA